MVINTQQLNGLPPKAENVQQHAVKGWPKEIDPLSKDRVEGAGTVLQSRLVTLHAEAHRGRFPRYRQPLHQSDEIGVGFIVEDNESRIHRVGGAGAGDIDSVGVSADVVVRFENHDFMLVREQVRRRQSGNPRTDNRNAHMDSSLPGHAQKAESSAPIMNRPGIAFLQPGS